MGKGIVIRVIGKQTKLSPELVHSLKEKFPDHELEFVDEAPDYRKSIKIRIQSLYQAFLFILEAYPPSSKYNLTDKGTLVRYIKDCMNGEYDPKELQNTSDLTFEQWQMKLALFSRCIVEVLNQYWDWPSDLERVKDEISRRAQKPMVHLDEAVACLNQAEQFVLMNQGRQDIVTLVPMQINEETRYILQHDKSLPPHYDLLIQELTTLKELQFPKTPDWFNKLPAHHKAYLSHFGGDKISAEALQKDLKAFNDLFAQLAKQSYDFEAELTAIRDGVMQCPKWFHDLKPAYKELLRELLEEHVKLKKLSEQVDKLSRDCSSIDGLKGLELIPKLPLWYWDLSDMQQSFWEHSLKQVSSIKEAISFISSRHRTVPAPANFGWHQLLSIDENGVIQELSAQRYRSSHIVSRDTLKSPLAVKMRHAASNIEVVLRDAKKDQPAMVQTLLSPLYLLDYVPGQAFKMFDVEPPPDLELCRLLNRAIQESRHPDSILSSNHPYNFARKIYYTEADNRDSLLLIKTTRDYLKQHPEKKDLEILLQDYIETLNSPMGTATFLDAKGRELFLSSLEQLMILHMDDYSYGSCVSGKDRKALELLHTDAMLVYHHLYGRWPSFGDVNGKSARSHFVDIFVKLYVSWHQQELAGQNAPGSEGTKTPDMYLPGDIRDAIKFALKQSKILDVHDRVASNNEVLAIQKRKKWVSEALGGEALKCRIVATEIGEELCEKLYKNYYLTINQSTIFRNKNYGWTLFSKDDNGNLPSGISSIQLLMKNAFEGKTNVARISKIFAIIMERPSEDDTRNKETQDCYRGVRNLVENFSPLTIKEQVNEHIKLISSLYEKSTSRKDSHARSCDDLTMVLFK